MLEIGAASLLQFGASNVKKWDSYYKLGQTLLQNRVAIANWGKMYYKLGQVLQIRAIITNWGHSNIVGGAYSPSCSNYALEGITTDHEAKYCQRVADAYRKNFHVGDLLKSVQDEQAAKGSFVSQSL